MIVHKNNGRRSKIKRRGVYVARPNQACGQRSRRDYFVTVDLILVVERKQKKMFFVGV